MVFIFHVAVTLSSIAPHTVFYCGIRLTLGFVYVRIRLYTVSETDLNYFLSMAYPSI